MAQKEATNHAKALPMEGAKVKKGRKLQNGSGAAGPIGASESPRFFRGKKKKQPPKHRLQFDKVGFLALYIRKRGDFPSGTLLWKPRTREQRTFHLRRGPINNDNVLKYVEVAPDFVRCSFNLQ